MITSSRVLMGASLALALAVHAALGWVLMDQPEVQIEGSSGAQETRLGNSFADMAVGAMAADMPDEIAPDTPITPIAPDTPPTAEVVPPVDVAAVPPPDQTQVTQPPTKTAEAPLDIVETVQPAPVLPPDAIATLPALRPQTAETPPEPRPAPVPPAPADIVEADEAPSPAVTRSRRPVQRSAAFEKAREKATPPQPVKTPVKPAEQKKPTPGNAEQAATAGTSSGRDDAEATSSGAAQGNSEASGNAAVSNYPGLVMRKLSRAPRPTVGGRGTAVVAFSVSASGGLAGVSIARSSGSAALDAAALRMVQRAAPFPPPPKGAQRSFSISIKGR